MDTNLAKVSLACMVIKCKFLLWTPSFNYFWLTKDLQKIYPHKHIHIHTNTTSGFSEESCFRNGQQPWYGAAQVKLTHFCEGTATVSTVVTVDSGTASNFQERRHCCCFSSQISVILVLALFLLLDGQGVVPRFCSPQNSFPKAPSGDSLAGSLAWTSKCCPRIHILLLLSLLQE